MSALAQTYHCINLPVDESPNTRSLPKLQVLTFAYAHQINGLRMVALCRMLLATQCWWLRGAAEGNREVNVPPAHKQVLFPLFLQLGICPSRI